MTDKANNILYFLIILLPPALVTGPFLPDLIISISSVIFLISVLYKKKINFFNNDFVKIFLISVFYKKKINFFDNDFVKIFLIFYFYIVIRSIFSEEVLFSLKNTFFYFRFLLMALLIKYLIINKENFLKHLMLSILLTLTIVSIDAILEFFLGFHWLFEKSKYPEFIVSNRISGLFDEEYILGGFILSLFPISLFFCKKYFQNKNIFINFLSFSVLILFIYTIIISGERATLAKLCLFFFIILLFTGFFGNWKSKSIYLLSFIMIIFLSISFQPILKNRLIYHTLNLVFQNQDDSKITAENNVIDFIKNKKFEDLNITYFSNEHTDHAKISLKMFYNNKLFGQGVKMFRVKCSKDEYYINDRACSTHSHGVVLSFISELGAVGLCFLVLIYFYIFKFFSITNLYSQKILLITIFIYLFPIMPSGYFFNNYFSIILYMLTGIFLGIKKVKIPL